LIISYKDKLYIITEHTKNASKIIAIIKLCIKILINKNGKEIIKNNRPITS